MLNERWGDVRFEAEEKYFKHEQERLRHLESQLRQKAREYEEAKDRFASQWVRIKDQEEIIAKQRAMRPQPTNWEPDSEDATFAADHPNITVFEEEN